MKIVKDDIASHLPSKLYEKLMPFQKDGVEFAVRKRGRCLIADEMGLGKTLQAISVAYYYRSEWPLLIIVPSSLRYCWIEEFEKWLPDVDPARINLIQSGSDASGIADALVTITTFGLLSKSTSNIVREALLNQGFQVTIVDESHYIRNVKTASSKIVVPLIKNANRRILLSGTPALARPVELYPQIDAVCPDTFGSWWAFTARYCDAKLEWIGKIKRRNVNGASNLEELQQKLSTTLMIRREKNEVLTQLPPKQRQRVLFELKDSEIKKEIRKTFEELRPLLKQGSREAVEVLTGGGDSDVKDLNSLALIQKLYQLSGEAKIGPAKEYVEMLCDNPNLKFLVFAYHRSMMNGLSQSLYDKKVKFIRIDGDTPPSERPQLVHQFQSDPSTRVAVLSILAAGVGLTFTAATVVVFAEMYWTPGLMIQCEDRAHRIGQNSCVAVHYLVAKDTMDEWVWSAVCKKTIVTSTTLTGKKQQMEADDGDKYQIDVLSNAEAWMPKENENLDLPNYFASQQVGTSSGSQQETRVVNVDDIPVYTSFHYQCSKYTGRIYVLTEEDVALNINFIPIDVEVGNHDDLPDLLLHPTNLRLVQRFVREWQSLSETKRRLIIKHSRIFVSPVREYEELKSCKTVNTQRHRTKEDTALAAMLKAAEVNGSVRVISKDIGQGHEVNQSVAGEGKGVTQAVSKDGVPLCLNCFEPYKNNLLQKSSIMKDENAWNTRFCSLKCSQEYWMKSNNDYCRDKVYEAERGICQMCGFDAHSLFKQVRDTQDHEKRAKIIASSKLNSLSLKTKQLMVKKPVAGQFWHVDHILPVWEGGGQCDIDNLRTLCITCHQTVTAKQARKRAIVRRLGAGAGSRDITAFFQKS